MRSFVADHDPVIGRDIEVPSCFWVAGQGCFGIMTAPALARIAADLITTGDSPADPSLDASRLGPPGYAPAPPADPGLPAVVLTRPKL